MLYEVITLVGYDDQLVWPQCLEPAQLGNDDDATVTEVRHPRLQVQQPLGAADIDDARTIAERFQERRQLPRALLVRPAGEPDQEVAIGPGLGL